MSRYVLTQEQLDRLQEQIQELSRINDVQQDRIRQLELHRSRVSSNEKADLVRTIQELENEINELKKANKLESKANATKIKDLETLLAEERKLSKFAETFAKQVELKCAEESLIRDLTTELCQLQKAEIEIDNKRIQELQNKLKALTAEDGYVKGLKETKPIRKSISKENESQNGQLKFITQQLKTRLRELQNDVEKNPAKTREDKQRLKEVQRWLHEIGTLVTDVNDIESMKKDLKSMKNEIEHKRKSILKQRN